MEQAHWYHDGALLAAHTSETRSSCCRVRAGRLLPTSVQNIPQYVDVCPERLSDAVGERSVAPSERCEPTGSAMPSGTPRLTFVPQYVVAWAEK